MDHRKAIPAPVTNRYMALFAANCKEGRDKAPILSRGRSDIVDGWYG